MKNNIFVLARSEYKALVDSGTITDQYAVISINEVKRDVEMFGDCSTPIMPPAPNVLVLHFDDVEEQLPIIGSDEKLTLFDEKMAKQIFDFVQANIRAKVWVIHCTSGQSRSGGVGSILADYFEIPYQEFKRQNSRIKPNTLVTRVLRHTFEQESII